MRTRLFLACLLTLPLAGGIDALAQGTRAPQPSASATLAPEAQPIRAFYDALLDSMKRARELGVMGRYKRLEPAIDAAFNFPMMTQAMVGPAWASMSATDQTALISRVRRMTIAGYAQNFDGYSGENFVVSPATQQRDGDQIVTTNMTLPGKEDVAFLYRMHNSGGSWKIVDVFLDGYVSQVAFRRSDFASTLRSGGAAALNQKLDALTDKMLATP
ncbi:hopanoid biosynthesis protein HpnM [Vineibacter terrae]|uniref:Hopanoid biosynthesis protein HpnM n=1 Tax=Vineibacter terrae TaxID=2586908 RepID=A0A5C8PKB5_9HYPH|nr:ABC transporter substrate-binding protein [Vineibacter terrae]TXL74315.1 hopanoid biosynthesis protein HpnM [Vineibacter terrae]